MEVTSEAILNGADAAVTNAFAAFCEDIAGMFDVTADCTGLNSGKCKAADLKKDFKKQISINHVQSKGVMQGTFDLIFDQAGTLILAGIFVMLPEKRILEYVRSGFSGQSDFISDAIREAGNLLVGSWDRIYRTEMPGHQHFLQQGTAVGDPWINPEKYFSFSPDTDCFYRVCQITINPYPPFKCAAVFPMSLFEQAASEPVDSGKPAELTETAPDAKPNPSTENGTAADNGPADEPGTAGEETPSAAGDAPISAAAEPEIQDNALDSVNADRDPSPAATEKTETTGEQPEGPVRQAIDRMVRPNAEAFSGHRDLLTSMTAEQVMKPAVFWADPEDTVEQVMKHMQHNETAYVLVGRDQQIEGLVSRSVIAGAVSPYLRAVLAHLKRPLDDASLQIRIKWFMSRPVHTVSPQASLEIVIHTMFKYGVRGLPVVNGKGSVSGFITVYDVLAALTAQSDTALAGKPAQTPMCL